MGKVETSNSSVAIRRQGAGQLYNSCRYQQLSTVVRIKEKAATVFRAFFFVLEHLVVVSNKHWRGHVDKEPPEMDNKQSDSKSASTQVKRCKSNSISTHLDTQKEVPAL